MSSEALYEQYKDALKRGHVASLRGRVDAALLAYAEAARIAPERSTPHTSAGTALLRRKRPAEAVRHYEVALSISPRDETALLGRAQALMAMDQRGDAANAFDTLADVQARNGRLADAVDAARRGLELAEGRERRKTLERLIERLRVSEPGEPGRLALERALLVLDGPAVKPPPKAKPAVSIESIERAESMAMAEAADAEPLTAETEELAEHKAGDGLAVAGVVDAVAVEPEGAAEAEAGPGEAADDLAAARVETSEVAELAPEAAPEDSEVSGVPEPAEAPELAAPAPEPAPQPAPAPAGAMRRSIPDGVTTAELAARAQAAADAGATGEAVDALLDLAALHARAWRVDAALDACWAALTFDPDSVELHLSMVELYAGRGLSALAAEKLDLLERIARLDGDELAISQIDSVRAARG